MAIHAKSAGRMVGNEDGAPVLGAGFRSKVNDSRLVFSGFDQAWLGNWRDWSSIGLAFAIVGLELGYILAYRSQWNISLGPLVANVAVAVLLLPVGLILFREKLSPLNALGVGVCLVGLMMVTSR